MLSLIGQGRPALFFLLLLLLVGPAAPAVALDFSAFWLYRESGGKQTDTVREFQQTYNMGAGPTLTYRPTSAILVTGFLGYSRTQRNLGGDSGWENVDRISPSTQVSLVNDIFASSLSGFVTQTHVDSETRGSRDIRTHGWDASLSSAWQVPLWPTLALNYGERTESESENRTTSFSAVWDPLFGKFFYQYGRTESEDLASGSLGEEDSHFARFETDGRLWQRRVRFNFAQQMSYSERDFTLGIGGADSFAPVRGLPTVKVDPVTGPNPTDLDYVDPDQPLPVDVEINERAHFRFATLSSTAEAIDVLRLGLGDTLDVQPALNLQWLLFFRRNSSRISSERWEQLSGPLQAANTSTIDENRIEIRLGSPLEAAEILLVATNDSGLPLTFTAFEAFGRLTEDARSSTLSHLTSFSTSVRISDTLIASTTLALESLEHDFADGDSSSRLASMSGNVRWSPTPLFAPSVGFSETRQEQTGDEDLLSRAYALTVTSVPLPTLNVTLGATRTDRFTGEVKTETRNNYSLATAARIYPDLSGALYLSYSEGERQAGETFLATDTFTSRLTLNARLNRAWTSDFTTNYYHTATNTGENDGADSTLSLLYRPSNYLSLNLTGAKSWTGTSQDSAALNLQLWLLQTAKTRLILRFNVRQADDTNDNLGVDWSWDISRALSLQTRFNYSNSAEVYSIDSFLTLRL